jgi:hypothetical protein
MPYTPPLPDPKAPPVRINLLSDKQTRPTPAMREAMARAEVGDEQSGDDPTVNLLCERVAELLGKEAAVFMPSGTMCNVAATLVHCRPRGRDPGPSQRPTLSHGKAARTRPLAASRSRRSRVPAGSVCGDVKAAVLPRRSPCAMLFPCRRRPTNRPA